MEVNNTGLFLLVLLALLLLFIVINLSMNCIRLGLLGAKGLAACYSFFASNVALVVLLYVLYKEFPGIFSRGQGPLDFLSWGNQWTGVTAWLHQWAQQLLLKLQEIQQAGPTSGSTTTTA